MPAPGSGRPSRHSPYRRAPDFGYDQDNRQVTMTDALSEVTTTAYDLAGNVVARVDGLGHVTS
jgi:YD repeat-containing protein